MSAPKMKAEQVKAALRARHGCNGPSGEWVCIEEAFSGWATAGGGIDVFAVGAWKTASAPGLKGAGKWCNVRVNDRLEVTDDARWPLVAYEVKVSRADYRREVNGYRSGPTAKAFKYVPPWPGKAQWALERSHYFMFATPKGLLTDDEIATRERPEKGLWLPPEAGLIEVDGRGCTVRVPAPRRDSRQLTRPEIAELVRHAVDPNQLRTLRQDAANAFTVHEVRECLGDDALAKLRARRDRMKRMWGTAA